MKNLLIILTILLSSSLFSNELDWVDEQVEAIKPARSGMSYKTVSSLHNPFVYLKKKEKENTTSSTVAQTTSNTKTQKVKQTKQVLTLWLIMNDSAKINDVWYKKGDRVNGYEIQEIDSQSVLLTKKKKKLLLSTRSSNKNLKFNNK